MSYKNLIKIIWLPVILTSSHAISNTPMPASVFEEVQGIFGKYYLSEEQKVELFGADALISSPTMDLRHKRARVAEAEKENENPQQQTLNTVLGVKPPSIPVLGTMTFPFALSPLKSIADGGRGEQIRIRSVYAWIAVNSLKEPYVPHEFRINFGEVLAKNGNDIKKALLEVEITIRRLIQNDLRLYFWTIYVGLAKNALHRSGGHRTSLKVLEGIDNEMAFSRLGSRKLKSVAWARKNGHVIHMSPLVFNIPVFDLKKVEVLVGHLFGVSHKASTMLGDGDAWTFIEAYFADDVRQSTLRELELESIVESLDEQTLRCTMPFQSQL